MKKDSDEESGEEMAESGEEMAESGEEMVESGEEMAESGKTRGEEKGKKTVEELHNTLLTRECKGEQLEAAVALARLAPSTPSYDYDRVIVKPVTNFIKGALHDILNLDVSDLSEPTKDSIVKMLEYILNITIALVEFAPGYSCIHRMASIQEQLLGCGAKLSAGPEFMETASTIFPVMWP